MSDERGIRVICRFRPQNKIEDGKGGTCCVQFLSPTTLKVGGHEFVFDRVFDGSCTQTDIFEQVKPAVKDVLGGYNATIFCYGQTSSGKTFTMQGPDIDNPALRGIIPRIVEDIFVEIAAAASDVEFVISASYLEIYLEKIRDLLDPTKDNLSVREDRVKGIYVQDMTEVYVQNTTEVFEVIRVGQHNRAISPTGMNAESSRSHSVFLLNVRATNRRTDSKSSGRLYLVDLAGSEKVGKTGASGTTLEEAKMINKSLSALGLVIKALTEGKGQHVPYRDSKLTRLLQESLGGNARTTLIINCSPSSYNEDETLSTLRFGARAKTIKNKVKANVERSPAELRALLNKAEAEIARLKAIIKAGGKCSPADLGESTAATAAEGSASGEELLKLTEQCREAQRRIEEAKEENTRLLDRAEALEDKIRGLSEQVTKGDAAEAALAELRERCAELTAENTGLRTELSEARRVAASTQMKLDDSGIQNEMLTKELARAREELESAVQHQHYVAAMSSLSASTVVPATYADDGSIEEDEEEDGNSEGDRSARGAFAKSPPGKELGTSGHTKAWEAAEKDIMTALQSGYERINAIADGAGENDKKKKLKQVEKPQQSQQPQALSRELSVGVATSTAAPAAPSAATPMHQKQQQTPVQGTKALSSAPAATTATLEQMMDEAIEMFENDSSSDSSSSVDVASDNDDDDDDGGGNNREEEEEEESAGAAAHSDNDGNYNRPEAQGKDNEKEEKESGTGNSKKEEEKTKGKGKNKGKDKDDDNEALRKQLAKAEAELEAAQAKAARAERLQDELAGLKATTERRLADMENLKNMLLQDVENKCLRSADLQRQVDELHDKYEALRRAQPLGSIRNYKKQIVTQQRALLNACREAKTLRSRTESLQLERDAYAKKVEMHLRFEEQLEGDIRSLQQALNAAILASDEAQKKLEELSKPKAPAPAVLRLSQIPKPIKGGSTASLPVASHSQLHQKQQQQQQQQQQQVRKQTQDSSESSRSSGSSDSSSSSSKSTDSTDGDDSSESGTDTSASVHSTPSEISSNTSSSSSEEEETITTD